MYCILFFILKDLKTSTVAVSGVGVGVTKPLLSAKCSGASAPPYPHPHNYVSAYVSIRYTNYYRGGQTEG